MSTGLTPLNVALEWRAKSREEEQKAFASKDGPDRVRKRAQTLRIRAEMIVDLLIAHGAVDRGVTDDLHPTGEWRNNSGKQITNYLASHPTPTSIPSC